MSKYKRPMQRSLLLSCAVFVVLMCVVLSLQTHATFSAWYYEQYNLELAHSITGLKQQIDVDDLQECIRTRTPSAKYAELQAFFNEYIDDYGLAYLYVIIPEEEGVMVSVCSATSDAEREAGDGEDWPLLYEDAENYTPESIRPYVDAWDAPGITYFVTESDWGATYTACTTLVASDGEKVAQLCCDLFMNEMNREIFDYVVRSAALSCGIGIAFVVLLLLWLRHEVTMPISKLEKSARSFAKKSQELRDPSMLLFDDPHINTQNEVESLSDAISQMSENMQDYVESIVQAELMAQSAQEKAEGMSRLAYEDALTHARSKAAYMLHVESINQDISRGQAEFAILMVDLNNLKYVNDTYGHDRGDKYLIGACGLIVDVMGGIPVYRTGGDEFVALLQGENYQRAAQLLRQLQLRFATAQADQDAEPWERYSAACGMANHHSGETYAETFGRADRTMYRNKARMKKRMRSYVRQR